MGFSVTCGVLTGDGSEGGAAGVVSSVVTAGGVSAGVAGVPVSAGLSAGGAVGAQPPGAHEDNATPTISMMVTRTIADLLTAIFPNLLPIILYSKIAKFF